MHKSYPKQYYFISKLDKNYSKTIKKTCLIYRNYKNKINTDELMKIRDLCKKLKLKLILSNNIKCALKLGLDGAYIHHLTMK